MRRRKKKEKEERDKKDKEKEKKRERKEVSKAGRARRGKNRQNRNGVRSSQVLASSVQIRKKRQSMVSVLGRRVVSHASFSFKTPVNGEDVLQPHLSFGSTQVAPWVSLQYIQRWTSKLGCTVPQLITGTIVVMDLSITGFNTYLLAQG